MRGGDNRTGELFSYLDLEARVRRDHPLRGIWTIVNEALGALAREFAAHYSPFGRPSIPPEKHLRAMLVGYFYIHKGYDSGFVCERDDFFNSLLVGCGGYRSSSSSNL